MLRDSVVAVVFVRTRPRAIPLAMITMRKSTHGFPLSSYMSMGLRSAINSTSHKPHTPSTVIILRSLPRYVCLAVFHKAVLHSRFFSRLSKCGSPDLLFVFTNDVQTSRNRTQNTSKSWSRNFLVVKIPKKLPPIFVSGELVPSYYLFFNCLSRLSIVYPLD